VSPLRGEKPQNRPLSKLNTGRLALCAMLPVTMQNVYMSTICVILVKNKYQFTHNFYPLPPPQPFYGPFSWTTEMSR